MSLSPKWQLAPNGTAADNLTSSQYLEYKETGKDAISPGNSSATRVFLVRYELRAAFCNDLLGYATTNSIGVISRILPEPHPVYDNFWAMEASVEGKGRLTNDGQDQSAAFTVAYITCTFKPAPYAILPDSSINSEQDRYTSRSYAFSADYLTTQGFFRWVSRAGNPALSSQPGIITGTQTLQYTWHKVPANSTKPFVVPNLSNITRCLGKVNSGVFDPNGGIYPSQTVLFIGVDPKMVTPNLTDGEFYWDITFSFLYRNNGPGLTGTCASTPITDTAGHNYIYDAANAGWDLVTTDGTFCGPRIYQQANLNDLWILS